MAVGRLSTGILKRCIFQSMNMNQEGTAVNKPDRDKKKKMLNIKISKHEFAHLLKMKEDSLFLQHLFAAADADNDELISFQEFLNIIALFTSGNFARKCLRYY